MWAAAAPNKQDEPSAADEMRAASANWAMENDS